MSRKRGNSDIEDIPSSPVGVLPPSSPPALFEEDEEGEIRDDIDDLEEAAEEQDGEDLFGDDMLR